MKDPTGVRERYNAVALLLDEKSRRLVAAAECKAWGKGGVSAVSKATGLARQVIRQGLLELERPATKTDGRIRRPGGGRKKASDKDPALISALEKLVDPTTRGDPESCLRWTCKSVRNLADELAAVGHQVSYPVVADLLHELGYSLQANRKTQEGGGHPDRNAQFEHIHAKVQLYMEARQPVISVDTKKKELVGNYKNNGQDWKPKGKPDQVKVHDFVDAELGRAAPYGVYDLAQNTGWVSVGVDNDTASFAVETIRRWWHAVGSETYPKATRLLITADGGGSNGSRLRLWKLEIQKLANETGLAITVTHFPPGTSKWNKIEHRLFSFISKNWRGQPLTSFKVIVSLIAATTTRKGLKVRAEVNEKSYPSGVKVTDDEISSINMQRDDFHGNWNYEISPHAGNVIS